MNAASDLQLDIFKKNKKAVTYILTDLKQYA